MSAARLPALPLAWTYFGTIPYPDGIALMEAAASALAEGADGPRLLMFTHPPTITAGVRARPASFLLSPGELATRGVAVFKTNRGGDATWHGPGQIVGYPVVDLRALGLGVPAYVMALERGLIAWLARRGARCTVMRGRPGVWTRGGRKIASIGVRVARGVATHGFALNLTGDLPGADAIVPCGIPGAAYTTLEGEAGGAPEPAAAAPGLAVAIAGALGMTASRGLKRTIRA